MYKFSPDFQLMADLRHPHVLQVLALDQEEEESTLPVLERMDKSLDLSLRIYLSLMSVLSWGNFNAIFVPWSVFVCVCELQCL